MKNLLIIFFSTLLISCIKADDFCAIPKEVTGFWNISNNLNPNYPVKVELTYEFTLDLPNTMFVFSTPSVFKTARNDNRVEAINKSAFFTYELKDPNNPPASVEIYAYAYNDCGKGEKVYKTLYYNTTP